MSTPKDFIAEIRGKGGTIRIDPKNPDRVLYGKLKELVYPKYPDPKKAEAQIKAYREKHYKEILEILKAESSGKPSDSKPSGTAPSGGGKSAPQSVTYDVKSMQQEMIIFGKLIFRSDLGTFLTYNYGNKFRGRHGKGDLTFKESQRYTEISEQITEIGSAVNEKAPDGIWGPRTQTGLQNIQSLTNSILDLANAIGFSNSSFSFSKNKELLNAIPAVTNPSKELNPSERLERSSTITPLLKDLNSFCKDFDSFLGKEYAQYDKGEVFSPAEVPSASEKGEVSIDEFDQTFLTHASDKSLNTQFNGKNISFKLEDLKSYQQFRSAIDSSLQKDNISDPNARKEWINSNYKNLVDYLQPNVLKYLKESNRLLEPGDLEQVNQIRKYLEKSKQMIVSHPENREIQTYLKNVENLVKRLKDPDGGYSSKSSREMILSESKDIFFKVRTALKVEEI